MWNRESTMTEKKDPVGSGAKRQDAAGERYLKPRLVKLGTIYKMSGGPRSGFEDVLMAGVGGTQSV